jgi:DNA polymerase-3 subunit epsilon/CBS domain-containing protein
MRAFLRHLPLFAFEAVVIDTETTGLDPRSARVVEIGAVVVRNGALVEAEAFRSFVGSGTPVPSTASAVHGIHDSDLVGAPAFPEALADLVAFVGERPVIGHSIGFDLAVLKSECTLAGVPVPLWSTLDTQLLAQIAAPDLADYSIESLAAWFRTPVRDRHRALGDATATALIFIGLVPLLRDRGIRTAGEAEAACRSLARVLEDYHRAGWDEPGLAPPEADRLGPERRLDSYPYRHRVRDLMSRPPVFVAPDTAIGEALATMIDRRISSVYVGASGSAASAVGIATERDVLRAIRERGAEALARPVSDIASQPLVGVPEDAFIYRAIGRMRRFNIRHLAAFDERGEVTGALSARDLLRLRADAAIVLGDDIDQATDTRALARAWAKVPAMAESLLAEDVGAREIAGIVARELGALVRRAGEIAERELSEAGRGPSPCPYALLVLGSAGRGESLLALDQDHAVIFESGEPDGPEDRWFESFGLRVADILNEVGVPYCPGGVMSGKAKFRGSLKTWRHRIVQWVERASSEDLLDVSIFFDFRPVHGSGALAAEIWSDAWQLAGSSPSFLRMLAEVDEHRDAPITLLGQIRTEEGRLDLKRFGLLPIVSSARLLALRHGVSMRSTKERLDGVRALGLSETDLGSAVEAHERFLGYILRTQMADLGAGRPASNRVPLTVAKGARSRAELKSDLRLAALLQELARDQIAR